MESSPFNSEDKKDEKKSDSKKKPPLRVPLPASAVHGLELDHHPRGEAARDIGRLFGYRVSVETDKPKSSDEAKSEKTEDKQFAQPEAIVTMPDIASVPPEVAAMYGPAATAEIVEESPAAQETPAEPDESAPEELPMEIEEELALPKDGPGPLREFVLHGGHGTSVPEKPNEPMSAARIMPPSSTPKAPTPLPRVAPASLSPAPAERPMAPPLMELPVPGTLETATHAGAEPETSHYTPNIAPAPAVVPATERFATQDMVRDEVHHARQRGRFEGLAFAGLAYVASRHRSKGELRRHATAERAEQTVQNQRLAAVESQQEQSRREQSNQQYYDRFIPKPSVAPRPERPLGSQAEAQLRPPAPEQRPAPVIEQAQETPGIHAVENVPQGHHIEHSQWHAIEVDDKTGKAVERTYGEAMRQERAPEQMVPVQSSNNGQRQAADDQQQAMVGGLFPSAMHGNSTASPYIAMQRDIAAKKPTTSQQIASNVKNPWFWLVIIFLIIVFFTVTLL
jgi:hypothetical protein